MKIPVILKAHPVDKAVDNVEKLGLFSPISRKSPFLALILGVLITPVCKQ